MTPVVRDYLRLVDRVAGRLALPPVRALHLPPEAGAGKGAEFCALELDDGSLGLCYLWLGYGRPHLLDVLSRSPPRGLGAGEVARWYGEEDPARRAVGFAALNAISQHAFARAGFVPDAATSPLALLDPNEGDHVGMVGLFAPLVPRILATGARLTVAELDPERVRDEGRFRVTLDRQELAACNKVISTSTVLLNGTLEDVLAACRGARHVGIVGPGAGCLPDPLFARGVSAVGGVRVLAPEKVIAALGAGERWSEGAEKYCITPGAYPGVEALLSRARGA